jgi:hypothetical protein
VLWACDFPPRDFHGGCSVTQKPQYAFLNFFLPDSFWAVPSLPHIPIASFLLDKFMPIELRMLVYRSLVLAGLTEFIVWLKILTQTQGPSSN